MQCINKMADIALRTRGKMVPDVESQRLLTEKSQHSKVEREMISDIIKSDNDEALRKLIEEKGFDTVLNSSKSFDGETILHKSADLNALKCMEIILQQNSDPFLIDTPDFDGKSPLLVALKAANVQSVVRLLQEAPHINARNDQCHSGLHILLYALHASKENEREEKLMQCLDLLLARPDLDLEARNNSAFTPLMAAAKKLPSDEGVKRSNGVMSFCSKLVSKGASLYAVDKMVGGKSCEEILKEKKALHAVLMVERKAAPQRPFGSKLLDSLILGGDEDVSSLLRKVSKQEADKVANGFVGSRNLLYYAVDKSNFKDVEALLEAGANPWTEQMSGEMCIHRALARGHVKVLDSIIDKMKKKKNVKILDLKLQSYNLLEKLLENSKIRPQTDESIDYFKCLERMLHTDIVLDLNGCQKDGVTQSILHLAASYNNQEAMRLFIERGAFIGSRKMVAGEDRGNVLAALALGTFEKAMDNCISYHPSTDDSEKDSSENVLNPEYTLSLDYHFLVPPEHHNNDSHIYGQNEVKTLMEISHSRVHRRAIKHPLIQALLYVKWRKVMLPYALNLLFYLTFVVLLTSYVYSLKDLRIWEEIKAESLSSNSTINEKVEEYRTTTRSIMPFLLLFTLYMVAREVFQLIFTFKSYHRNFENYLEWFLIIVVAVLCSATLDVEVTRHLAAWSMIIAWYEFVLLLGRSPPLTIYVTMLRHVSWNFLKLIFLYGALILAFTVSFNIILQPTNQAKDNNNDFSNFWTTLPKAIVMATGEFEYSDLSEQFSTRLFVAISAVSIFLVFLFLIFLVLMNVMNGLAVADTQQVMDDAILYSLTSRLELIFLIEKLHQVPFLQKLSRKIHVISSGKKAQLLARVNLPKKRNRIIYGARGEEFCKLDNTTAHVLRSHRLAHITAAEKKLRGNPLTQCLCLLRELREIADQNRINQSSAAASSSGLV